MTGECILKLMDDHAENSNVQNNYDSKMELSGDEVRHFAFVWLSNDYVYNISCGIYK